MAKKKVFGGKGQGKDADRRMAKVIVAQESPGKNYNYKEAIIDENDVQSFIKENRQ